MLAYYHTDKIIILSVWYYIKTITFIMYVIVEMFPGSSADQIMYYPSHNVYLTIAFVSDNWLFAYWAVGVLVYLYFFLFISCVQHITEMHY